MADVVLKKHCKLLSFLQLYLLFFYLNLACHIGLLTKLHPNGSIDGKVMTSYRFFQRATIELEIYPGFGFSDSTKIRSRDNFPTSFDLIFHFCR